MFIISRASYMQEKRGNMRINCILFPLKYVKICGKLIKYADAKCNMGVILKEILR